MINDLLSQVNKRKKQQASNVNTMLINEKKSHFYFYYFDTQTIKLATACACCGWAMNCWSLI